MRLTGVKLRLISVTCIAMALLTAFLFPAQPVSAAKLAECRGFGGKKYCFERNVNPLQGTYVGDGVALNMFTACKVLGNSGEMKHNGSASYAVVQETGAERSVPVWINPFEPPGGHANNCTGAPFSPNSRSFWPAVFSADATCSSGTLADSNEQGIRLCVPDDIAQEKNNGSSCEAGVSTGNPINHGTGNKYQHEVDFQGESTAALVFARAYNLAPTDNIGGVASSDIGRHWRHHYTRAVKLARYSKSVAMVDRQDGRVLGFFNPFPDSPASTWTPDDDINDRLNQIRDQNGEPSGWLYWQASDDSQELYDKNGKLMQITFRGGQTHRLTYSNATTPRDIAPKPDLLLEVRDHFGRRLQFTYDMAGRIVSMTDPAGGVVRYAYDEASAYVPPEHPPSRALTSVTYPDGGKRLYWYNEQVRTSGTNIPYALTGITDENGDRYASFTYDRNKRAIATEYAGGANRYSIAYDISGKQSTVTDPNGTQRIHKLAITNQVVKTAGQSQPAGAGCGPAASIVSYDVNGNVSSVFDFNGRRTSKTYDLKRNLETSRTEAIGTTEARTISTEWDTTFRLPTRIAEPLRLTINTYDGRGNLLQRSRQATNDASGAQGFAAVPVGPAQTWRWTYDDASQVLSETDPRGGLTRYQYDAEGNLIARINPAGHATRYTDHDAVGRVGRIIDPNGLQTTLRYSPRGWLISKDEGGEVTRYRYDAVGQMTQVTMPSGAGLTYTYDSAHRLTHIADSQGNRISYTLDAAGNRVQEHVTDPTGKLKRQTTRVFDALNRVRERTGALQ